MLHLIVSWFLSALALWLVAQIIPGIEVRDFAVAGSLVLTILTAILRRIVFLPGHEWTHSLWNTW